MIDALAIGTRIGQLRERKRWSQLRLAVESGVTRDAVVRWENGHSLPRLAPLCAAADALGVSIEYLIRGKQ